MRHSPKIFCAIDTPDLQHALTLAGAMQVAGCGIKLGLEFFCANGAQGAMIIRETFPDLSLFLDLKFHDIPNTVAGAIESASPLAPAFITVHASGGVEMMRAAQDAAEKGAAQRGIPCPHILAVTVLTSLDDEALIRVGQQTPVAKQVQNLAQCTRDSGLPGIVCAGPDIAPLRAALGPDLILMVPGIRPTGADIGDQKRVMSPADALRAGATHLVIGRPITKSPDPLRAARDILASIAPET